MEHRDEGPSGDQVLDAADLSHVITGIEALSTQDMVEGWCQRAFPRDNKVTNHRLASELVRQGLTSLPQIKREVMRVNSCMGEFGAGQPPGLRVQKYLEEQRRVRAS